MNTIGALKETERLFPPYIPKLVRSK